MGIVDQLNSSIFYVIALTFLIGIFNIKKYWNTPSVYLLIYLGIVLLIEFLGSIIENNHWLYNIQSLIEFLTYALIFYSSVKHKKSKVIIIGLTVICILYLGYEICFIKETFNEYLSHAFGLISFAIPLMCFVYLFEMMESEKILNQNKVLLYWICIGLLIYHLCNLPATVLINDLNGLREYYILYTIQALSSIAMYSCFMIGFIWSDRKYNI